ncbi:hypothetical protein I3F58_12515 [Streptomyces sp. MUM 203J]|uniref:hypothetical protein n=1 Tax=Streptomyces sp. MUM 203J TaxID=2791990 RepID=UPI001F04C935|nr:hypothetical protein [Streptomyces sp. MUM 203J]MCH0540377.1 hypothetical protein [Streptomyces sp. MUM 203J]
MELASENRIYRVQATLTGRGWRLDIPESGEVWVRRLTQAMSTARDFIAERTESDPSSVNVQLDIDLGTPLQGDKKNVVEAALEARRAQEKSSQAHKKLVRDLKKSGISGAEIALILGISRQRISQIMAER